MLTAGTNSDLLIKQALKFQPNAVVIADESQHEKVFEALFDKGIKVYSGPSALEQVVEMDGVQIVLTALVGAAGLKPTLSAIRANKHCISE